MECQPLLKVVKFVSSILVILWTLLDFDRVPFFGLLDLDLFYCSEYLDYNASGFGLCTVIGLLDLDLFYCSDYLDY